MGKGRQEPARSSACADRDDDVPPSPEAARAFLVWRRGFVVLHRAVSGPELVALERVRQGTTFADVCDAFSRAFPVEEAAARSVAALGQWIADEVLAYV